jgi:dihydrofolate reductase
MRKLTVFNHVSLDGYFTDANGEMNFAHRAPHEDPEWDAFTAGNASGNGALVFGRVTYEMMASFWPTPMASESMPTVAEGMNRMQKIVFSRTLHDVTWQNTRLVNGELASAMSELKREAGPDMVILGSGSIVAQLARAELVDAFEIIVNPVVLGRGRTLFEGAPILLPLKLTSSRPFRNGNVLLRYARANA